MEYLGANDELYIFLTTEEYLPNGKVKRVNIHYLELNIEIELDIELIDSKRYKVVRLIFKDVLEHCFFNDSRQPDLYIEHMKFLKLDSKWYISLDPFDESLREKDERDNYFILSESIAGYVVEKA